MRAHSENMRGLPMRQRDTRTAATPDARSQCRRPSQPWWRYVTEKAAARAVYESRRAACHACRVYALLHTPWQARYATRAAAGAAQRHARAFAMPTGGGWCVARCCVNTRRQVEHVHVPQALRANTVHHAHVQNQQRPFICSLPRRVNARIRMPLRKRRWRVEAARRFTAPQTPGAARACAMAV